MALEHLFDRCHSVNAVGPVQVDVVGLQPAKRAVDRGHHGPAAVSDPRTGFRLVDPDSVLGSDNEVVTPPGHWLAHESLGLPGRVALGGVDERATRADAS